MKWFLFPLIILMTGCNSSEVTLNKIEGNKIKGIEEFYGEWRASNGTKWTLQKSSGGDYQLEILSNKKSYQATITSYNDNLFLWVHKEKGKVMPFKMLQSSGQMSFVILRPDIKKISSLINKKKVKGNITDGHIETNSDVVNMNDFWDLSVCLNYTKVANLKKDLH